MDIQQILDGLEERINNTKRSCRAGGVDPTGHVIQTGEEELYVMNNVLGVYKAGGMKEEDFRKVLARFNEITGYEATIETFYPEGHIGERDS